MQISFFDQGVDDISQHLVPGVDVIEKFLGILDFAAGFVVVQIVRIAGTGVEMAYMGDDVEGIDALGISEADELAEHRADAFGDALVVAGKGLSPARDIDDLRVGIMG